MKKKFFVAALFGLTLVTAGCSLVENLFSKLPFSIGEKEQKNDFAGVYHISKIYLTDKDTQQTEVYKKGDTNYFGMTLNDEFMEITIKEDNTFTYEGYVAVNSRRVAQGTGTPKGNAFELTFTPGFDFGFLDEPITKIVVPKEENGYSLTLENSIYIFKYIFCKD